jgi:hypothetical protein
MGRSPASPKVLCHAQRPFELTYLANLIPADLSGQPYPKVDGMLPSLSLTIYQNLPAKSSGAFHCCLIHVKQGHLTELRFNYYAKNPGH